MLVNMAGTPPPWPALPIPIWLQLPVAAAIVWWGAKRDLRWTVPVAAALSVPALWSGAFAILAACWPLRRHANSDAPAAREVPDYHAADARQPRGDRKPVTA